MDWRPERLDLRRLRRGERFGKYGLYRLLSESAADNCWQAEVDPGVAWDLPPRVFLRRFRGRLRRAELNDDMHRYMMLAGGDYERACRLEELTEIGVESAVPYIGSMH